MEPLIWLFTLFIGCLLTYFLVKQMKSQKYPPGPIALPFVGNSPMIKKLAKQYGGLHKALQVLSEQYRSEIIGVTLGNEYFVIIMGLEYGQEIFKREEFQARPTNFFIKLRCLGEKRGVSMTDGPLWEIHRAFLVRHLRQLGLGRSVMESLIHKEVEGFSSRFADETMHITNMGRLISGSVLNVLWAIVSGELFPVGDSKLKELYSIMSKRSKSFDMAGGMLAQFPWIRFIAPEWSGYNIIDKLNKELRQIFKNCIAEHRLKFQKGVVVDFIGAFLQQMEDDKENNIHSTFTEDQLIMTCVDLFIAGSQTTSNTIEFLLLRMVLSPEVQEKAYNEISSVLANGELPKLSDRSRLPYVEAVILECQRINYITPLIGPRRTLWDTEIKGYHIPKGATVLINLETYLMDPVKWGDPHKFKPERFLNEEGNGVIYSINEVFGAGKRKCPGEPLAKNFIFIFFVRLLQQFKISVPDGEPMPSLKPIPGISLSPQPFTMKLERRK